MFNAQHFLDWLPHRKFVGMHTSCKDGTNKFNVLSKKTLIGIVALQITYKAHIGGRGWLKEPAKYSFSKAEIKNLAYTYSKKVERKGVAVSPYDLPLVTRLVAMAKESRILNGSLTDPVTHLHTGLTPVDTECEVGKPTLYSKRSSCLRFAHAND